MEDSGPEVPDAYCRKRARRAIVLFWASFALLAMLAYVSGYLALGNVETIQLAPAREVRFRVFPSRALTRVYKPLAAVESIVSGKKISAATKRYPTPAELKGL